MPNIHERLLRLRSRSDAFTPVMDPYRVLAGLSPQLVLDLARLAGSTLDEMTLTLQLLPWGDRSALAAYGVVVSPGRVGREGTILKATPLALDVAAAAADVAATVADSRDVAALLQDYVQDPDQQAVPVKINDETEVDEMMHVTGRVAAKFPREDGTVVEIDVVPDHPDPALRGVRPTQTMRLWTNEPFDVSRRDEVLVALRQTDSDDVEPFAVAPRTR